VAVSKGKPDKLFTGKKLYGTSRNDKRRIRLYAERVEASATLKRQLRQYYCIEARTMLQRYTFWYKTVHTIINCMWISW